jgi:hypothetical protein
MFPVKSIPFFDYIIKMFLEGMWLICYGLQYSQLIAVTHLTDFKAYSSVTMQHL